MIDLVSKEDVTPAAEAEEPAILYEDGDILAVNKPAGLLTHGDGRAEESTLAGWVLARYPSLARVGEPMRLADGRELARPGIVHRLDRETSGVVLVAKTQESYAYLKHLFQAREIEKTYNVFFHGVPSERFGRIARPIGRSRSDFRKYSAERGARGKLRDALTLYRVLESAGGFSFVEARPKTGRTHQIRVHFKAIGHPVLCDRRYGGSRACALGFARLALHARQISLTTSSGMRLTLEAPLPDDFTEALALLGVRKS